MEIARKCRWLLSAVVVLAATGASAQGRTDGPEGSEFGHGGFDREGRGAGRFSLSLDWGAVIPESGSADQPLHLGLTAGFLADDWVALDVGGHYSFASEATTLLVGPKFRTTWWDPLSFNVGLKVGPTFFEDEVRFTLSPTVGADFEVARHFLLGAYYAWDKPLGGGGPDASHRLGMSLGYRF